MDKATYIFSKIASIQEMAETVKKTGVDMKNIEKGVKSKLKKEALIGAAAAGLGTLGGYMVINNKKEK